MTTLTVNIDNKKTEKAIKAVLDAFGLAYNVEQRADSANRPLTKSEQVIFDSMKRSLKEIELHQQGKSKLQNAKEALQEIEASLKD